MNSDLLQLRMRDGGFNCIQEVVAVGSFGCLVDDRHPVAQCLGIADKRLVYVYLEHSAYALLNRRFHQLDFVKEGFIDFDLRRHLSAEHQANGVENQLDRVLVLRALPGVKILSAFNECVSEFEVLRVVHAC